MGSQAGEVSGDWADYVASFNPEVTVSKHRTDLLIKKVCKYLDERPSKPRSPGFHVSQMYDYCPRQKVLMDRAPEGTHKPLWDPDAALHVTMDVGTAIHSWFQDEILGPAGLLLGKWAFQYTRDETWYRHGRKPDEEEGLWTYVEPSMRMAVEGVPDEDKWHLTGSCDGLLVTRKALEAKSCGPTAWPNLIKGYERLHLVEDWTTACGDSTINGKSVRLEDKYARGHAFQLKIYMEGIDPMESTGGELEEIESGVVFYIDKTTRAHKGAKGETGTGAPFQEFELKRDTACIDAAKDKIRATYEAEQDGESLPFGVCQSRTCWKAKDCPVANECFAASDGGPR